MKQYLDLLQNIIDNGVEKESGRANMPNTIGISNGIIKMNLQDGFPLLTTKKMYWKGIVHELLWFLRGETNIKYLVDNNVNIWNGDAYRWYLKYAEQKNCPTAILYKNGYDDSGNYKDVRPFTLEEFIATIKDADSLEFIELHLSTNEYALGNLGKVYGYQWRNQNGVDQVKEVLNGLKSNPYSRYHIIDAWNKADFKDMALPPCHLLYQFIVRPLSLEERQAIWSERIKGIMFILQWENGKTESDALDEQNVPKFYLDLNMYQRSCDTVLGVPFNIASMSLLLKIFARVCNMAEGIATWIGGDTHIYINHMDAVNEQLSREPMELPKLFIKKELNNLDDILALTIEDFELVGYKSHPAIKAELFTGLKK
jgi:thymidylate synthase